jgi:hypothetical protein
MRDMERLTALIGTALLVMAVPVAGHAQQAPPATIDLTVTEALKQVSPGVTGKENLRDVPPPRPDRLSSSVRITVVVGDPRCEPGEDGAVVGLPYSSTARQPRAR